MLDQRLLRDNPELIVEQLGRRGMTLDLTALQLIARQERDLEQQRSDLQAEGNRIGRQVGELIRAGEGPHSPQVQALRDRGNTIKQQVAVLEEEEKSLENRLREQLLAFPNLPSPLFLSVFFLCPPHSFSRVFKSVFLIFGAFIIYKKLKSFCFNQS